MIEKITIERFKNINKIELGLGNINVLVGSNNSGKSSILQGIQFAVSIAQTTSLEEFRFTKWKNNILSTSLTPNQIIYTPIRDIYSLGSGGSLSQDKQKAIVVRFQEKDTNEIANFQLSKGRNKNLLTKIEGRTLGNQIRNIENPYTIYVPGLAGISAFEELKSEGIVRRAAAKGDANSVFRNILWLLKQDAPKWESFIADFKDIFQGLTLNISFDKLKDEHINATIWDGFKNLPIDAYGTGVLQAVQILSYIHLYHPKILILDEPDSHLHPSNQRIIAEKLSEITQRLNFQLILSTHSRHLLDAFKDYANVQWISKGEIKDQEYNFISVLLEIGALDKGDILNNGNTKCVVLSEDANNAPLKTVLNANGFVLAETDIWTYEGCSKIDTAIVLAAFIKKNAPATSVIIHRDSDYLSDVQKADISTKAATAGIGIFFTNGTDIENHFLNASHIQKVYPEMTLEDINVAIAEATTENEEKSQTNFINSRTQEALKIQYAGGAQVNNGQISLACIQEYQQDSNKFRHGKKVFKTLRNKLQNLHGQKDILIPTVDLISPDLTALKDTVWTP